MSRDPEVKSGNTVPRDPRISAGLAATKKRGNNRDCDKCHRLVGRKDCHHKTNTCDGTGVPQVLPEVQQEEQCDEGPPLPQPPLPLLTLSVHFETEVEEVEKGITQK